MARPILKTNWHCNGGQKGWIKMNESMVPVLIVAIVFSFVSFSVYLKYKSTQMKLLFDKGSEAVLNENEKLKAIVTELEKRVQVVEAIVTDDKARLHNEINSLA
ncbi:MAG: cell division protein YceG involved in septum cleavage [Pseudohongiellaceae bacterium]